MSRESESGLPDRARLRARTRSTAGTRTSGWASRATTRTPAASTRRCTPAGRGRCGSTPGSAPPRSPTSATTSWSRPAPAGCRWPSTCRPRWATTPTTRSPHGEVGKVGVAIDSIEDMRTLFDGIPLDEVSTSMTINAPAALLLLLYQLVARGAGRRPGASSPARSRTTCSRSTSPAAPTSTRRRQSLRLITDIFAYCHKRDAALEHHLHLRLPHGRGRGDARAGDRVHPRQRASSTSGPRSRPGLDVDDFAPRLSFFFVARTTLLEEVAKFRAARRIWARVMRDEFGAQDPQVADAALPHPDRRACSSPRSSPRSTSSGSPCRGSAAVLGGTQSLHTNSYDEAIALPDREGRPPGAAHPAGDRLRDRRDRDRRPVRRLLRRRVDDRRRSRRRSAS